MRFRRVAARYLVDGFAEDLRGEEEHQKARDHRRYVFRALVTEGVLLIRGFIRYVE